MKNDNTILTEKQQSALSPSKIDEYEYLTGEKYYLAYSPLGKAFEKQIKTIEEQGKKLIKSLKPITQKLTIKDAIPENILRKEVQNELNKIKEIEKTVDRENLCYKANEYTYNFQNFGTINTFSRDSYNGKITLKAADKDQSDLLVEILNFR